MYRTELEVARDSNREKTATSAFWPPVLVSVYLTGATVDDDRRNLMIAWSSFSIILRTWGTGTPPVTHIYIRSPSDRRSTSSRVASAAGRLRPDPRLSSLHSTQRAQSARPVITCADGRFRFHPKCCFGHPGYDGC